MAGWNKPFGFGNLIKSLFFREQAFFSKYLMQLPKTSRYFMIFGFGVMLIGVLTLFLIVTKANQPTLLWLFFSQTLMVVGGVTGMLGVTGYADDINRSR